jgi:hypothetical protein
MREQTNRASQSQSISTNQPFLDVSLTLKGKKTMTKNMQADLSFLVSRQNLSSSNTNPNLAAASTVASKHAFENFSDEFGIHVGTYLADNHPFRSSVFV